MPAEDLGVSLLAPAATSLVAFMPKSTAIQRSVDQLVSPDSVEESISRTGRYMVMYMAVREMLSEALVGVPEPPAGGSGPERRKKSTPQLLEPMLTRLGGASSHRFRLFSVVSYQFQPAGSTPSRASIPSGSS